MPLLQQNKIYTELLSLNNTHILSSYSRVKTIGSINILYWSRASSFIKFYCKIIKSSYWRFIAKQSSKSLKHFSKAIGFHYLLQSSFILFIYWRGFQKRFSKPSSYLISHILKLDFSLRIKYFQEIYILCKFIHIEP